MPAPKGDPTYIRDKDIYFLSIARTVQSASTHPASPGGALLVRDRNIIGDGRSILTHGKVEIDAITYAIAAAARMGTPTTGAVIYSTRYPFPHAVFQAHVMGIRRLVIMAHDWEPYFKDQFRSAARLSRELEMTIEAVFEDRMPKPGDVNPFELQEYDPADQYASFNEEGNER